MFGQNQTQQKLTPLYAGVLYVKYELIHQWLKFVYKDLKKIYIRMAEKLIIQGFRIS